MQFFHVNCTFDKITKARTESNIIKDINDIDGIEDVPLSMVSKITTLISDTLAKIKLDVETSTEKVPRNPSCDTRKKTKKGLRMLNTPSIKILFTNADQLTPSKKSELEQRIVTEKPMIIAVSEVKPKNSSEDTEMDYHIEGYTIRPTNIETSLKKGRGIIIYTHTSLDKSTIQIKIDNKFEESCVLEIRLRGSDVLLFGCMYRSPTPTESSVTNNENLNQLLKTICNKKYSHVCLLGDFNYRDINWKSWTTPHGDESKEFKFIECLQDCFLFQHVDKPTRARGNDEPSLIDLLLTNEEHQVSNVVHHAPLGKVTTQSSRSITTATLTTQSQRNASTIERLTSLEW